MIVINGEKTREGCTYRDWEHNTYHDSDFYATSVDPVKGITETVEYNSTRYGGGGYATVDLTRENLQMYLHNAKSRQIVEAIAWYKSLSTAIGKGKEVIVVKGRKVPHGVIGVIFWERKENYDRYGRGWNEVTRIGIKDADGNVYWTYAHNVEVNNPSQYIPSIGTIRKKVQRGRAESFRTMKVYV
jgi:hypothetical protein